MIWLAISIFLSTVLYLVDKNQKWKKFWGIASWLLQIAIGVVIFSICDLMKVPLWQTLCVFIPIAALADWVFQKHRKSKV